MLCVASELYEVEEDKVEHDEVVCELSEMLVSMLPFSMHAALELPPKSSMSR